MEFLSLLLLLLGVSFYLCRFLWFDSKEGQEALQAYYDYEFPWERLIRKLSKRVSERWKRRKK